MDQGIVVGAPNLPAFDNYPVRDEIEKLLGAKVILENDANAAALGEKWIGAGRDVNDLILLTLGTGIGSGIIVEGKSCAAIWGWRRKSATPHTRPTATPAAAATPAAWKNMPPPLPCRPWLAC